MGLRTIRIEVADMAASVMEKVSGGIEKATRAISRFDQVQGRALRKLRDWTKEKYRIVLDIKDKVSPILDKLKSALKSVGQKAWSVTMKAVDLVTPSVQGLMEGIKGQAAQVIDSLGIPIGLGDTIETYKNFEAAMSRVKAITGASGNEMERLSKKAMEMGNMTKFSASEAVEGFHSMAESGWKTQDMLDGAEGVMSLAAATGEDLGEISGLVAGSLAAFGAKALESGHFADVFVQTMANAGAGVQTLGESLNSAAPAAGAMGYVLEDVSLALGLMSMASVEGEEAGNALKTALENMSDPTKDMASAMKQYGISLTDSQGNMKTLKGVMDNLRSSLGGLDREQQKAAVSALFGEEAMAGILSIVNTSESDYNKLADAIGKADGASKKMSHTMSDNLEGAFKSLQNAAEKVKLSFGERLKPYIQELATWLTDRMPEIEAGLNRFMDYVDQAVEQLKTKITEFTGTSQWKNVDLFGKIEIAWNEIIAEPFLIWWESKGRSLIADKARSIGQGIGYGVTAGLMALLGIDLSEAVDEGAGIGSAFARGLLEGFQTDALKGGIGEIIKGIFSSAAEVLPGNEGAGLSSWLSAALVAHVTGTVVKTGAKGFKLGKSFLGSETVKGIIGSADMGTGVLGFGAKAAIKMGGGNLAGGASLSSGALSALGLGAIAGGVVGGATLISGGMDLYKGFKSDNEKEASAYKESAAWKTGGVAAGAAAGAALGVWAGGIGAIPGALIGAGIGGIAGWIKGDSVKKDYEEDLKAAQEAEAAAALKAQQAKYQSQDLKDALADTTMTAEKFGQKFQEAVGKKLQSRFGDIKLSLMEIRDAAQMIVFDGQSDQVERFAQAAVNAQYAFSELHASAMTLEKLNWKASLGLKFSAADSEGYKAGIENLIQSAKSYVENSHYEVYAAFDLLLDVDSSSPKLMGLNEMYAGLGEQIESLESELEAKMEGAFKDGIMNPERLSEITDLQNQITEITNKVSDARTEAKFEKMKVKYSGADMDAASFAQMQAEIQQQTEALNQGYDEALEIGITNLNLAKAEGKITQPQYDEQMKALTEGYQAKISDLQVRAESFQLEAIAEAFGNDLEGILPELEGTTAEKLGTAFHNAMASGVDVTTWDLETASKWLGLEGLSRETQAAVTELMNQLALTLPESAVKSPSNEESKPDLSGLLSQGLYEQLAAADLTTAMDPIKGMIQTGLITGIAAIKESGIGAGVGNEIGAAIASADMQPINSGIDTLKLNTKAALDTAFAVGFSTTVPVWVRPEFKLVVEGLPYHFPQSSLLEEPAANAGKTTKVTPKANGGFVNGPMLSLIGEDGPEAIIPLGSKRRGRGLSLWEKAGRLLGVPGFADGGMIGNERYSHNPAIGNDNFSEISKTIRSFPEGGRNALEPTADMVPMKAAPGSGDKKEEGLRNVEIKVEVHASPSIQVSESGKSETDVLRIIKGHMKEMADELGGEIASRLEAVFSNMPLKEA